MNPGHKPVRLAIAGCGLITDDSHLPAALRSPNIDVVALIDPNTDRARSLSRKYGRDIAAYTRLEEVVSEVDGVLVATPNYLHGEVAKIALGRGVPALIEKPLTTSYAEAIELCELAERNNTFISVGYFSRHYPVVRLFKELLLEGFFGAMRSFHFEAGTAGGWTPMSNYNLDPKQSGGGVLVVRGTHFLDRMIYWFGMPESFSYADDNYGGVEANCKATVTFNGAQGPFSGTLFFSKTIDLKNRFIFETDIYRGEIPDSETEQIRLVAKARPGVLMTMRNNDVGTRPQKTASDCFQDQLEDFAQAIRLGTPPLVDGRAGALSVKLFEDFYLQRTQLTEPWRAYSEKMVGVA